MNAVLCSVTALCALGSAAPLFEDFSEELQMPLKRAAPPPTFGDIDSVCEFFHRKCLLGENSNEKCEEPHRECVQYGQKLLRGAHKLCMFMLEDAEACEVRQLQVISKLARDIHRNKASFMRAPPARRSYRAQPQRH